MPRFDLLAIDASVIVSPLLARARALEALDHLVRVLDSELPHMRVVLCFDGAPTWRDERQKVLRADTRDIIHRRTGRTTAHSGALAQALSLARYGGVEINRVWWVASAPLTADERRAWKPLCFAVREFHVPLGDAPRWGALVREMKSAQRA